jgi:hypothetical protein
MGFIGVMCMVLATAPMMLEAMGASALRIGYLTLMAAGIAAIVGFWLAGLIPSISHRGRLLGKLAEFVSLSRHLAKHPQLALRILGWAIIANLCNTIGIWLISTAYGYEISFYVALVASSTIFWVALMPISFSGWGLREGAAVVVLGLFGIGPSQAFTVSVTMGIAVALVCLPGLVLFALLRRSGGVTALAPKADGA